MILRAGIQVASQRPKSVSSVVYTQEVPGPTLISLPTLRSVFGVPRALPWATFALTQRIANIECSQLTAAAAIRRFVR